MRPPLASSLPGSIRAEFRTGRLSLGGLGSSEALLARAATVVSLVACAIILATSLGIDLPGGSTGVVGHFVDAERRAPLDVPLAALVFICVGLAVGAATLAAAAVRPGGTDARRLMVGLSLVSVGLGGLALTSVGGLEVTAGTIVGANGLVVSAWNLTGVLGLMSGSVIPLLLLLRPAGERFLLPAIAAAPFVAMLVTVLLAIGHDAPVGVFAQALAPDYPAVLSVGAPIHGPILFLVGLTGGLIGLLTIWQTTTWSRASARQLGRRLGRRSGRWWWLLGGLLGAKLAWLALGLSGQLPAMLGGASGAWVAIRSDDLAAFTYAAFLVIVAGVWLLRRRRRLLERQALRWAGLLVIAISAFTIITTAVPLLVPALDSLAPSNRLESIPVDVTLGACLSTWAQPTSTLVSCLGLWLPDWQNTWLLLVLAIALVSGLMLSWRRPNEPSATFLVVLGAWGVPRGLQAAAAVPPPELPGLADLPSFNAPQPETLDVAVTVLVLVLAVAWWTGRQTRVSPADLLTIMVVSTLVIHGATLVPTTPLPLLLAAIVTFPILYELGFDSEDLNERAPADRPARVLGTVGGRALALTLLATALASGAVDVDDSLTGQFAFIIFGLPFAVTIVAATLPFRGDPTDTTGEPEPVVPPVHRARVFGSIVVGGACLVMLTIAATALTPVLTWLYPTPLERLGEFEARIPVTIERAGGLLATTDDSTRLSKALDLLQREEEQWLREHGPPDCAAVAWRAWREFTLDLRELGLIELASQNVPSDARTEDLATLSERIEAMPGQVAEHGGVLESAVAQARIDCDAAT